MSSIRVLIADDSVVYRSQIRIALEMVPGIEIAGVASNGKIALDRMSQSKVDLLVLDLEMPEMDGIQTLIEMKKRGIDCRVLVFSSVSKRGAEITLEALRLGASDFVTKPDGSQTAIGDPSHIVRNLLEPKIAALFPVSAPVEKVAEIHAQQPSEAQTYSKVIWDIFDPKVLVIGASTGGPTALEKLFGLLPSPFKIPIVIAQHMPPIFTETFAQRLGKITGARSKEIESGEVLTPGTIYLAPGNFHARMRRAEDKVILSLDQSAHINSVRPAVDPLFETAADIFGSKLLAMVLTGMGADGKNGAIEVKKRNGAVLIQNKESCVVFGMPGAVYEAGAYDEMGDLEKLADLLIPKICDASGRRMVGT